MWFKKNGFNYLTVNKKCYKKNASRHCVFQNILPTLQFYANRLFVLGGDEFDFVETGN